MATSIDGAGHRRLDDARLVFPGRIPSHGRVGAQMRGYKPGCRAGSLVVRDPQCTAGGERRGRIDATQTAEIIAQLDALPIDLDREPNGSAILALARAHGLTFYDAAYLELALRVDAQLATLDRQLVHAARAAKVALLGEGEIR